MAQVRECTVNTQPMCYLSLPSHYHSCSEAQRLTMKCSGLTGKDSWTWHQAWGSVSLWFFTLCFSAFVSVLPSLTFQLRLPPPPTHFLSPFPPQLRCTQTASASTSQTPTMLCGLPFSPPPLLAQRSSGGAELTVSSQWGPGQREATRAPPRFGILQSPTLPKSPLMGMT